MTGRMLRREQQVTCILRAILLIGGGIALLLSPGAAYAGSPAEPAMRSAVVRVLSSTSQSLVFEFTMSDYALHPVSLKGQTFLQIQAPDLIAHNAPGAPQVPGMGVLVGLPSTGRPQVSVVEADSVRVPLTHLLSPEPAPQSFHRTSGEAAIGPLWDFTLDETLYRRDAFYPSDLVDTAEVTWLRNQRIARIALHPLRYNPVRGELEVTRHLVVRLDYPQVHPSREVGSPNTLAPIYEQALQDVLLNSDVAREWQVDQSPPAAAMLPSAALTNPPASQANSYKVIVEADGLYQLTYADLQAAGLPVASLDPCKIQLFEAGQEISTVVLGPDCRSGQTGHLSEGDRLLFYGRVPPSRYTHQNVYWLRYGDTAGRHMTVRQAISSTLVAGVLQNTTHWEENHYYDPVFPAADGDHWYAADLRSGDRYTATLALPSLSTALTATLRVGLVGYTVGGVNPDHHAVFSINGRSVGDLWWHNTTPIITATFSLGLNVLPFLHAGSNSVTISLPGITAPGRAEPIVEGAWLDSIELDYACLGAKASTPELFLRGQAGVRRYTLGGFASRDLWLYDATDPQQPVLLQGFEVTGPSGGAYTLRFGDAPGYDPSYLVLTETGIRRPVIVVDTPSTLHDTKKNRADYLIITHADFKSALTPLVSYRQSQGLQVRVVDVQDVYDEYNDGRVDPEAIRTFIAYAETYWTKPVPGYVLLVGDGSYDFQDYSGYGAKNYIPPYLEMINPVWGETAADNRYAVTGDGPLPDIMLGRLPVDSAAEAVTVVQKILDYERTPVGGDWNKRQVFIADVADPEEGDFAAWADMVYNAFVADPSSGWLGQRIYLDDLPGTVARQDTLAAWNQGALLMSYIGHSSWHQWASISVEDTSTVPTNYVPLFHLNDIASLHNGQRLPVVLGMTCYTGFFHHPQYRTLDESLLGHAGGGAVATWSPSGMGLADGHYYLHRAFYQRVFGAGNTQLGSATWSAKVSFYAQAGGDGTYGDLINTYHLFGDPAMTLNLTVRPQDGVYLPFVRR